MKIEFLNLQGDFRVEDADNNSYLYFPIGNESGIMSNITPTLKGDNKTGQNSFLLEPVSAEDLHESRIGRNLWFRVPGKGIWAANGCSPQQIYEKFHGHDGNQETVTVEAGKLWHTMTRYNRKLGLKVKIINYVPVGHQTEIMKVIVENTGVTSINLEPIIAVPIYARSADNLRDHRHVTSLLHRIFVKDEGIEVIPTLSFDERGHGINRISYGVYARDENGNRPVAFYPILEEFLGEGENLDHPKAVMDSAYAKKIAVKPGDSRNGFEAMGAMEMAAVSLSPGENKIYYIALSYDRQGIELLEPEMEKAAFLETQEFWQNQTGIEVITGSHNFDSWLKWVCIQPTLRRIYGCSFLPNHDYGRGGRGYRDLWQDSLALLLNSKESIRDQLVNYFGGVRIDGSNATIIGKEPGEFVADRNSIVRMWMDHGVWPMITTLLYVNQTGDYEILLEEKTYFKDALLYRGIERDGLWQEQVKELHTHSNEVYRGSILEHILLQNLTAFYDVGKHGHLRLLGADWNDALDMAVENGESVAFSAAYAGNLENLALLLEQLEKEKGLAVVELAQEVSLLMGQDVSQYEDTVKKQEILKNYCASVGSYISGKKIKIPMGKICEDLLVKADQLKRNIRKKEWLSMDGDRESGWFNSYYDNHSRQVEGVFPEGVRMMLTGQVFTIMNRIASDEQIPRMVKAADDYLFDVKAGGYRLNTNFHELKTDLGRMFGFAYGTKENGAVFSHMAVMYAYALYSRGFVAEGYKALNQLFLQVADSETSIMYPGIPEYFNQKGRGLYCYLTGAASWYMFTMLTQVFGVRGKLGNLTLEPKLLVEQFDNKGEASITSWFADKKITVIYENPEFREIGDYEIEEIWLDDQLYQPVGREPVIKRKDLAQLDETKGHTIRIKLA